MTKYPERIYHDANGNKRIRTKRKYFNPHAARLAVTNLEHYGWEIESVTKKHTVTASKPCE